VKKLIALALVVGLLSLGGLGCGDTGKATGTGTGASPKATGPTGPTGSPAKTAPTGPTK